MGFIPIISHMILISKLIIITLIIQPSFVLCLQSEDEDNVDSVEYTEHIEKQVGETFLNINSWTNSKNDTTEEIGNTVNDINQWFTDNLPAIIGITSAIIIGSLFCLCCCCCLCPALLCSKCYGCGNTTTKS